MVDVGKIGLPYSSNASLYMALYVSVGLILYDCYANTQSHQVTHLTLKNSSMPAVPLNLPHPLFFAPP